MRYALHIGDFIDFIDKKRIHIFEYFGSVLGIKIEAKKPRITRKVPTAAEREVFPVIALKTKPKCTHNDSKVGERGNGVHSL